MMWIIIVGLISLTFLKFFWDYQKKIKDIQRMGGMSKKYEKLIYYLKEAFPGFEIMKEKNTYIVIGSQNSSSLLYFDITDTFADITIMMVMKSNIFGEHKLNWEFDKKKDPEFIVYKIIKDMNNYASNHNIADKADNNILKTLKKIEGEMNDNY